MADKGGSIGDIARGVGMALIPQTMTGITRMNEEREQKGKAQQVLDYLLNPVTDRQDLSVGTNAPGTVMADIVKEPAPFSQVTGLKGPQLDVLRKVFGAMPATSALSALAPSILPKAPLRGKERYSEPTAQGVLDYETGSILPGTVPQPKITATSDLGKLKSDLDNGLITPDQYSRAIANALNKEKPQKPEGLGTRYRNMFGGDVEAGMMPEVGPDGTPTGRQVPIPGGAKDPVVIAAAQQKKIEAERPGAEKALYAGTAVFQTIKDQIKKLRDKDGKLSPAARQVVGSIQGREMYPNTWLDDDKSTAWSTIQNLRNVSQIQGLQNMRASSPTGGAVGSVTEKEWPKLESALANLDPTQSEQEFDNQLSELERRVLEAESSMNGAYEQQYGKTPPRKAGASGGWAQGETRNIGGAKVTLRGG